MTGGWRGTPLAPVYALLITAALVGVGGAALQSPTHILFRDVGGLPRPPFPVALISERDNRLLDTAVVDADGRASVITPTENAQLCVVAPARPPACTPVRADTKELTVPPAGASR